MSAIPSPDAPLYGLPSGPDVCSQVAAVKALHAWLASDTERPLAVTGPVGIGKSTVLRRLSEDLAGADDLAVVALEVVDGDTGDQLLTRVHGALDGLQRAGDRRRPLVLLDDVDRLPALERTGVLTDLRQHQRVRVVVTATVCRRLGDVISVALPPLPRPADVSMADFAVLRATPVTRLFLDRLRRHNPVIDPDAGECGRIAQICASSFGIPAEIELLAELADRHGIGTVADAVSELRPRHHLGVLVEDLSPGLPSLTGDAVVVLASVFAAPGGAGLDMLRQSLPRCAVDEAVRDLVHRGLLAGVVPGNEGEAQRGADRYHLRVSGTNVGSWCAAQSEVSLAAIRHAHADYLHGRLRRMVEELYGQSQRAAFTEFRTELPNLRCTVTELIAMGRWGQALGLLSEALPLLARTCGLSAVLPDMLRLVRLYDPIATAERGLLATVALRVFAASGEQEVAATYLDQLEDMRGAEHAGPGPLRDSILRRTLTGGLLASAGEMAALAEGAAGCRAERNMADLTDIVAEYLPRLVRSADYERAEHECRTTLAEVTRCGDDYLGGLVLLWRAVVACAANRDDARVYVERALTKLRPLGPEALLSALSAVVANRHLRSLTQASVDLAMLIGALSRSELLGCHADTASPLVIPAAEQRIADQIGVRAAQRWSTAGAAAEPVELLVEILRRRWVDDSAGPVELRRSSGVATGGVVASSRLSACSELTAREAEVASLVATGLTNRQVAFRLQISEWTVINHLRQVMRKLDCTSRVQVARWVSVQATTS